MKRYMKIFIPAVVLGLFLGFSTVDMVYGAYPDKMINWVCPFATGGGTDRVARILSTGAIDNFGQPWHVINIPGASAIVGWKDTLTKPADGYTIMQSSSTPVLAILMEEKPPLDPLNIKIVCYVGGFRSILVVKPDAKWNTWDKFKAHAKKNPGKISIAGTMSLLLGQAYMFEQAGIKVNYVPYPSTGGATADFLGGHVVALAATSSTAESIIPGSAIAVVNTSDVTLSKKVKAFEGVPNAEDLGYKGLFFPRWIGVHPDTPDDIVDIMAERIGKVVKDKNVVKLAKKVGEELTFFPRAKAETAYKEMIEAMKKAVKLLK